MRRCLASLAFILLSLGWGATGRADEAERDQERARSFDDAADRYLTQDRYAESIKLITRAQLLSPNPERLRSLGIAFMKVCQRDLAIEFYERYRRELNCERVEGDPKPDPLTRGKCSDASNHIAEMKDERHCSEQEGKKNEAATIKADLFARAMSLDIRQRSEEALSAYLEFRRQARCEEVESSDSNLAGQCRDAQVFFNRLADRAPQAAAARKFDEWKSIKAEAAPQAAERARKAEWDGVKQAQTQADLARSLGARARQAPPAATYRPPMSKGKKILAVGIPMLLLGVSGVITSIVEGASAGAASTQLQHDAASATMWSAALDQEVSRGQQLEQIAIGTGVVGSLLVLAGTITTAVGGATEGRDRVAAFQLTPLIIVAPENWTAG